MLQLHSKAAATGSCRVQTLVRHRRQRFSSSNAAEIAIFTLDAAAPASNAGILGLQGVCSPGAYVQHWQTAVRPRLDAVWGSILRTNNTQRLLFGLDGLLMQLRSSRSLALHIQQQHVDHEWVNAAAQVAADCKKYEIYICTNKTVAAKLQSTYTRLLQAANSSNQEQQPLHANSCKAAQSRNLEEQQLLLQLCHVLLAVADDNLPADSLEWLAALEAPDSNAQQLQQLKQEEREIVAAVDNVLNSPVAVQLPADTSLLLAGQAPGAATAAQPAGPTAAPAIEVASSTAAVADQQRGLQETQHALHQLTDEQQQQQPADQPQLVLVTRHLLVQLLQQCNSTDVRQQVYATVLLPKLQRATALLDQLARCRHCQAQLTGYNSYLEQTESRIALRSSKRLAYNSNNASTSGDSTSSMVDFLLQLSEVLKPLAWQEVEWVMKNGEQLQQQQQQGETVHMHQDQVPASSPLQQQQQQHEQHRERPAQGGFGPWDWDWLFHQAQAPLLQRLREPALAQHMQLDGVLCGFSSILQQLLGVQLLLRPVGQSEVWGPHVRALMVVHQQQQQPQDDTALMQQQLQSDSNTMLVESTAAQLQDQTSQCTITASSGSALNTSNTTQARSLELLGVVYLDISGGYGTRMLRFTRQEKGQLDPGPKGAAAACPLNAAAAGSTTASLQDWESLDAAVQQQLLACCADVPAVAVGISGSRVTVQRQANTAVPPSMAQRLQEVPAPEHLQNSGTASSNNSSSADVLVLSVPQLWEFGHEMGHALHLVLSSRQSACHLSGRYLPPSLLEVPAQIFEHLFTSPSILCQVCLHPETGLPLSQQLASVLAQFYRARYSSALALAARAAAGLSEQMYGQFGDDPAGSDIWRGSWELLSGLPGPVAAGGCLKELSLLPVVAAHRGTYHCYLTSWVLAAQIAEHVFKPLVSMDTSANLECNRSSPSSAAAAAAEIRVPQLGNKVPASYQAEESSSNRDALQQTALGVMSMDASMSERQIVLMLGNACGVLVDEASASLLDGLIMPDGQLRANLDAWLWKPHEGSE